MGRPVLATSSKSKDSHPSPRLPSSSSYISSCFLVFPLSHIGASFPLRRKRDPSRPFPSPAAGRPGRCTSHTTGDPSGRGGACPGLAGLSRFLSSRLLWRIWQPFRWGPWALPHPCTYRVHPGMAWRSQSLRVTPTACWGLGQRVCGKGTLTAPPPARARIGQISL